jgi:hypothetical protein
MAKTSRGRLSWLWRSSPIGRKGPSQKGGQSEIYPQQEQELERE